ncbi:hypothetical protein OEB99_12605 [Actinotalea sp. M2MS4P-6]|nr:hypothetical protein [Actinotalea sp. M2MS4P-6]MCV2395150.1 hypothetical protein [Actinotalea sp. M2MS4P-6]
MLRRVFWMSGVILPHALAVVLGVALFAAALSDAPGFAEMTP